MSRSAGAHRINSICKVEPDAEVADSFARVVDDASLGQGVAADPKSTTSVLSSAHYSIGNSVELKYLVYESA